MTEQELRDKIADKVYEILRKSSTLQDGKRILTLDINGINKVAERVAYALISIGIGDVSKYKKHRVLIEKSPVLSDGDVFTLPEEPPKIIQLYGAEEVEKIVKERDEYKHRAEVEERALMYAVSEYRCDECPLLDCNAEIRGSQECIDCICEEYKKQAEKELQEEGKDD